MQPEKDLGDLDQKDNGGNAPIHLAAAAGHVEAVRTLLRLGAAVNQRNQEGATPLHRAAEEGHHDVVKILLESGADPTLQDNNGATPSHLAASGGHVEIMELMSKRNGNEERVEGDTNIESPESKKDHIWKKPIEVKTYAKIRNAKAKIDEASNKEEHQCSEPKPGTSRDSDGVEDKEKDKKDDPSKSSCSYITRMSNELDGMLEEQRVKESINEISRGRVDVNGLYYEGYTPLLMAARYGAEEATRKFLKKRADVHVRTKSGLTPIMLAAAGGSVRVIKMLVKAGAEVVRGDLRGLTPIHAASYYGHESAVRYFHSLGVDVHAQTTGGETALHIVARKGDLRMAIALLNLGARVDTPNKMGVTPLMLAEANDHKHLVALFTHWDR